MKHFIVNSENRATEKNAWNLSQSGHNVDHKMSEAGNGDNNH